MKALKTFVEIATLKQMTYEEINELINKLNDENEKLRGAANIGLKEMKIWLYLNECECDTSFYGNHCGRERLERSIYDVEYALAINTEEVQTEGK